MMFTAISGETRRLIDVPLVAGWLGTQPEWTALIAGITNIRAARADYATAAQEANGIVDKLQADVIDALLAGKPVPTTLPETAGNATRTAQDMDAAWNLSGRVLESLTWAQDAWPRNNSDALLQMIRTTIERSVSAGRVAAKKLGNSSTPEDAARASVFDTWKDLEAAHAEYSDAKYAHRFLMEATQENEPLRSIFWIFKNAGDIYPQWEADSLVKPRLDHSRPWPADIYSLTHFLWLSRHAEAEAWAPTTEQVREAIATATQPTADRPVVTLGGRKPKST